MREAQYRELLMNNKLQEHVLPLFDILEKYIDNKLEYSFYMLNEVRDSLDNNELKEHISEIGKEARKRKSSILAVYVRSLQRNISDFVKMNENEQNARVGKLKKLLVSYINVTRYVIDYEELDEMIKNGPQNGEKVVLALGLIRVEEDDIKVNEEINMLVDLSRINRNYFVIPVYACTTTVFVSINQKMHADIIHMAGHGINENGKRAICFVDSNMTYTKLCEKLATRRDIIFLNCCHTYEFVQGAAIPISDYSVVHEEAVASDVAYNFSEIFYGELWRTEDIIAAWNTAKTIENPLKYCLLQ